MFFVLKSGNQFKNIKFETQTNSGTFWAKVS